jgi:hypothetical protein
LRIGKHAIAFLPAKSAFYPFFAVDKFIALYFYLFHKVGYGYYGLKANKQVQMVGHAVNGE